MKSDSFTLEGRVFVRQQHCRGGAGCVCTLDPAERENPLWVVHDLVSDERQCLGSELPPEVQMARAARDDLRPRITAARLRLREVEQALGRLDRGDPLRPADRAVIAACGFGAALIGGMVARLRDWGAQLLRDVFRGVEPPTAPGDVARLRSVDLCGSTLLGADLSGVDLSHARLCGANLTGANLREAKLVGVDLGAAILDQADLEGADLTAAILARVTARWADLRAATLCGADLREANLLGANLDQADLRQANLMRANLDLSTLHQANLLGAVVDSAALTREQKLEVLAVPCHLAPFPSYG